MSLVDVAAWLMAGALLALPATPTRAQAQANLKVEPPDVSALAETAYRFGDWPALERLYATYGKAGIRSPATGVPRLQHFWMGIGKVSKSTLQVTDEYYQQQDLSTAQWARLHPESVLAQLLYASALETHAWARRGTGYADTVSPTAWTDFRKYLDMAAAQLQRAERLATNDSAWNEKMLSVGRGLGWDIKRLVGVFEDGIKKNPDDDDLYFVMLESLLPRWGGDLATIDRYITKVVRDTRERLGMEMYARLWAAVSYREAKQALFTNTRASWPSMKVGFEDRLSRYPHSDHRNMYAYFACMAEDRTTLQEQLRLIGDKFEPLFWGSDAERTYEDCKRLAQQA